MSLTPFFSANGLSVGNLFNPTNVVLANGSITAGNTVTANYFIGNGALLTGIGASTSYSNANVAAYLPNYQGQISNIDFRSTSPAAVALVSNSRPLTMGGNTLSYVTLPDDANANVIAAELTNHGLGNVLISSGPDDHEWIFDNTGNLTLPGNTWSVYYANGTQVPLGAATSYSNADVANYLASNANVTILTTGNITGSYISGNGIATTTVAATPPANPEQGDIWIRSDTGIQYIYFSSGGNSQWAEMEAQQSFSNGSSIVSGYGNTDVAAYLSAGIAGNIIPSANVTYSLGNATNRWNNLYLAGNTIYLGSATISANGNTIQMNGSSIPATYPNSGIAVSTGSSWTSSLAVPAGNLVGTTETQTLTNKTLNNPILLLSNSSGAVGTVPVSQGDGLPPAWGNVTPAEVRVPTNVSPANAAANIGETPTLTASTFYSLYGFTMSASQWQVATNSNFSNVVIDTGDVAGNSVSYSVSKNILAVSTTYYWRARYKDSNNSYSDWSTPTTFTTINQFAPSTIGQSYGGGYYAGMVNIDGTQYYLIVAPLASGRSQTQWKTTNTSSPGTTSNVDGWTNSNNMNNASHPAAYFCRGLTIGGYTDWYMPATNELEICYYNLKPTTAVNDTTVGINANAVPARNSNYTSGTPTQTSALAFRKGNSESFSDVVYWTSTELTSTTAQSIYFDSGYQQGRGKTDNYSWYVRAIRRIAV